MFDDIVSGYSSRLYGDITCINTGAREIVEIIVGTRAVAQWCQNNNADDVYAELRHTLATL